MTFKHVKFEDSAVMRSLEKVASQKGLVKADPLKKTASKQTDLIPTTNLTENILKLCEGLRQQGFNKYADELEDKFVVYKQAAAATLYETTSEEGEDLVDAAHPKGSHHLEGVDSDEAVIETILDQHLKDTKMVEKTPTGKLASQEDILSAVHSALGGSFLGNGRADGSRKIAQETPPASGPGIATDVAATAGFMGGVAGLKWLWSKFSGSPALDKQLVKNVESALGRNLSKAEANALSKQLIDKVGKDEMQKVLGKQVAQQVEKKVITQAVESGAKSVVTNVVENAATKSPGLWSRVVGFFGRTATLPGGAAAGAGEAGTVGAGEVAGGAAVGAGATAAAAAASFVVAATVTYLITSAIYENKFYTAELKEAGNKLINELKDVETIPQWQSYRAKEITFQQNFAAALSAAETAKGLVQSPTPAGLDALKKYADALQEASTAAYSLSAAAREVYSGEAPMKPGESREDSWYNEWIKGTVGTSPIARLVGADAPQLADVTITGANFVNAAQRALVEVRMAINKVMEIASKEVSKQVQTSGGPAVNDLQKEFADTTAALDKYKQTITARRLENAQALNAWCDKIKGIIKNESDEFAKVPDANKPDVAKYYSDRLNNQIRPKIKAFVDKWMS